MLTPYVNAGIILNMKNVLPLKVSEDDVYRLGLDVFENHILNLAIWMATEHIALDRQCPIDLMNTEEGRMQVYKLLGQIESKVYN